jgi:uncharacterized protein (TIGR00299 family) protein
MKIAYFDCASGISGDMVLGALVDLEVDLALIQAGIDSLGLPSCRLVSEEVKKKGFRALHIQVQHEPEHAHRHLHHITKMINDSALTDAQKDLAKRIFTRLGEAEAFVHGTTIEKVHFHEVGAVDSIADIVGCAIGLNLLGVDRVESSPIPTGCGHIEIAHGRVSVPAPATAELLRGVPIARSSVEAELTTPTGAAIISTIAERFGPVPSLSIDKIGCGAGTRDLDEQPNLLRLIVGKTAESANVDSIWVLETNLDDCSGEVVGHCISQLENAGALDVFTSAIQMKKNRPGIVLSVLCNAADVEVLERIIFRETTTLGVRRWLASRHTLVRRRHEVETPWGRVVGKIAVIGEGVARFSPEYESCREIAQAKNIPLREIYDAARRAFDVES